jgi:ATP-binding cassette subfamily B protein
MDIFVLFNSILKKGELMKIIWTYLKPFKKWLFVAMGLAAEAQILELIDPIIFGKIIDNFAVNIDDRSQDDLVGGVLKLLALAIGVALLARLAHAFKEYFTRLVVHKFGLSIFDEGLKQTLRLPYGEFEGRVAAICCRCCRKYEPIMSGLSMPS